MTWVTDNLSSPAENYKPNSVQSRRRALCSTGESFSRGHIGGSCTGRIVRGMPPYPAPGFLRADANNRLLCQHLRPDRISADDFPIASEAGVLTTYIDPPLQRTPIAVAARRRLQSNGLNRPQCRANLLSRNRLGLDLAASLCFT